MSKALYPIVDGKTRKTKAVYAVIGGKTRKVTKIYTVVNGQTKPVYDPSTGVGGWVDVDYLGTGCLVFKYNEYGDEEGYIEETKFIDFYKKGNSQKEFSIDMAIANWSNDGSPISASTALNFSSKDGKRIWSIGDNNKILSFFCDLNSTPKIKQTGISLSLNEMIQSLGIDNVGEGSIDFEGLVADATGDDILIFSNEIKNAGSSGKSRWCSAYSCKLINGVYQIEKRMVDSMIKYESSSSYPNFIVNGLVANDDLSFFGASFINHDTDDYTFIGYQKQGNTYIKIVKIVDAYDPVLSYDGQYLFLRRWATDASHNFRVFRIENGSITELSEIYIKYLGYGSLYYNPGVRILISSGNEEFYIGEDGTITKLGEVDPEYHINTYQAIGYSNEYGIIHKHAYYMNNIIGSYAYWGTLSVDPTTKTIVGVNETKEIGYSNELSVNLLNRENL